MLTNTQLRTAKTAELERLQARIQAELDSRIEAELENRRQRQKLQQQRERGDAKDQLFYSGQVVQHHRKALLEDVSQAVYIAQP